MSTETVTFPIYLIHTRHALRFLGISELSDSSVLEVKEGDDQHVKSIIHRASWSSRWKLVVSFPARMFVGMVRVLQCLECSNSNQAVVLWGLDAYV